MPGPFITLGQGRVNGFIAASQPASRLSGGQYPQADTSAAIKQPSRDFGANIDVPQPGHITRALVSVIF
jgi:hypothetical protein